jgi:glycosyltransferase involved in cell wall biosynthesis
MPLIEGMAAGIPVITGTGSSLVEVGGTAVIYENPLNEEQLALAMIKATHEATRADARTTGPERLAELIRRQQGTRLTDVVAAMIEDG